MLSLLKPFNGEPWFDKKGDDKKGLLPDKLFGGHWLQACYSDAFGDAPPRKVSKRQTFRNGGGNFLSYFDAKISDATSQEIDPDLSKGLKSEAESKPLVTKKSPCRSDGSDAPQANKTKAWPKALRKYFKNFKINAAKFDVIIERVVKNGVLKIFLSSPFDGCLEERDRFMKTELPVLEKELEPFGVHVSVVDMRWGYHQQNGGRRPHAGGLPQCT